MHFSILFGIIFLASEIKSFRLQGAGVRGKLLCNGKPLRNVKVKLYDLDRNPGDSDDLLDEKYSDRDGDFQLDGTTRELTDIEPVLYIYHDCEDGIRPCQKKIAVEVPKRFIHHGKVKNWMEIGSLNLENEYPNQDRSCDH